MGTYTKQGSWGGLLLLDGARCVIIINACVQCGVYSCAAVRCVVRVLVAVVSKGGGM